ncbi:type I pullulanase [Lacticaseibacillus kribbianus]|uniref:type I pullulanase n=1 Tax=Lacticaseibacillus kribbianus TaxID=2926292 RepID=UPI001CD51DC8|nr:type I pullulanase [Lacticaseibacillus kribbianus]
MFDAAFDAQYAFDGWLGVRYTPEATAFRLWAPTATSVTLCQYQGVDPQAAIVATWPLTRAARGVWTLGLPGDRRDLVYTYQLTFADRLQTETIDPYATAATVNGLRGVVLAPEAQVPERWTPRLPAFGPLTDAVITELHLRDVTSGAASGVGHKGQYLGLAERGTCTPAGQPTGLSYLAQSGTTHVQIMPMFDFATVDEAHPERAQYNWGYDPVNYNVPEGSYATNACDPAKRLVEAKTMIQALHDAGIRVIMDVVYNHVFDPATHAFNQTVPGYFFRTWPDGTPANGTGVGNDVASERAMVRKYIVDSVCYWARAYHIDGFRFDLMGILDVETMRAVREALDAIDDGIVMLGEGWDMATPLAAGQKATRDNAAALPGVAFFDDDFRDLVKGHVFTAAAPGFVSGEAGHEAALLDAMLTRGREPAQEVQYVEVHDNLTLLDKLAAVSPGADATTLARQARLANAMVALSPGVPLIQLGQAFMRSKGGDANSYRSPDAVNAIDWTQASVHRDAVAELQALWALRAHRPELRPATAAALAGVSRLRADDRVIAWRAGQLVVAFNAAPAPAQLAVPGAYRVLFSSDAAQQAEAGTASVALPAVGALVLALADAPTAES